MQKFKFQICKLNRKWGFFLKEVDLKKSITMQMELQPHILAKLYAQQNIPSELTEKILNNNFNNQTIDWNNL